MSYSRKMTGLACFVASRHAAEYDRDTIEMLVGACGWEVADDFYELYEIPYGISCAQQRIWIYEMAQEDE